MAACIASLNILCGQRKFSVSGWLAVASRGRLYIL